MFSAIINYTLKTMEEYGIIINSPEFGAIIDRGLALKAAVKANLNQNMMYLEN